MYRLLVACLGFCALALPASAQSLPDNVCQTLKAERARYQTPVPPAGLADILNRTAFTHRAQGYGLMRKTTGNRCMSAAGSIKCDALVLPSGVWYDVLGSSETLATVQCSTPAGTQAAGNYVAAVDPHVDVDPVPDPAYQQQINVLKVQVKQLQDEMALVKAVFNRHTHPEPPPPPPPPPCVPTPVSTNRAGFPQHSHTVMACH